MSLMPSKVQLGEMQRLLPTCIGGSLRLFMEVRLLIVVV